jgi:two-component system chemotaxis sensor kinase CheA
MIEDEELRGLFKTESEEHLQRLEAGILRWEKQGSDRAGVEELLREAHTLKGDARMLGVKDVETLAHQIEHLLGIQPVESALSPETCDRFYQGLDAIRKLVREAVTGEAANVNTFYVLAHLMGASPPPPIPASEDTATSLPSEDRTYAPDATYRRGESLQAPTRGGSTGNLRKFSEDIPLSDAEEPASAVSSPPEADAAEPSRDRSEGEDSGVPTDTEAASSTARPIETIRVDTRNLDRLMTKAGELKVTKIRLAHQLAEIEALAGLWEEWSQEVSGSHLERNPDLYRTPARIEQLGKIVSRLQQAFSEDITRLDVITDELEDEIRTLRLLPLSAIFNLFPRMVRDLAKQQGKAIELAIAGETTKADKRILEEMKDPLMHLLRNCVDHGIETAAEREQLGKPPTGTIRLVGYQKGDRIWIEVSDDGRGLDVEAIKHRARQSRHWQAAELDAMSPSQIHSLIFAPGFSTRNYITEVSGRGVGLDVVRANVERLKGSIFVESSPGKGCTFRIQLGRTLATLPVLIVAVSDIPHALPVESVQTSCWVGPEEIFPLEGRDTLTFNSQPISVARLADLLELAIPSQPLQASASQPCVILNVGNERIGLLVDALLDQQEVILKPQSKLLKRVRNVLGATILSTGEVCMVLNPSDLVKSVQKQGKALTPTPTVETVQPKPVILLAEDSIATRTQEKRVLEGAGYEVVTAVDGLDAFNKLIARHFDAIISDVQMPNLDGFSLVARIRQHQEYNELPVILVTSLASDEDKKKGAEVGANAYITKDTFNQDLLLETLQRLI